MTKEIFCLFICFLLNHMEGTTLTVFFIFCVTLKLLFLIQFFDALYFFHLQMGGWSLAFVGMCMEAFVACSATGDISRRDPWLGTATGFLEQIKHIGQEMLHSARVRNILSKTFSALAVKFFHYIIIHTCIVTRRLIEQFYFPLVDCCI